MRTGKNTAPTKGVLKTDTVAEINSKRNNLNLITR